MAEQELKAGDAVFAFYRTCERSDTCQPLRQYLAVLDPKHGSHRPRMGLSDGFIPGTVVEDPDVAKGVVMVAYTWPHFYTERGHTFRLSEEEPWIESHRFDEVRRATDQGDSGPPRALSPAGFQPELGILSFRWGGINRIVAAAQWGVTGSSVSDLFVNAFLEVAQEHLGKSFEVWTVYVEDSTDLAKLADSAHLIFGPNHPVRRAKHVCGMYFLYPTAFEENCIPTMETGEDRGAAMVDQKSLLRVMKAVERAGIPTRFPHSSGLYQQLASKSWTHVMSIVPQLRVVPTVGLPRMLIERNCQSAAESAVLALESVKECQAAFLGEDSHQDSKEISRGVAKLGFSWEALDVKYWEGQSGLQDALWQLTQQIDISGEMTGQPHDCETVLVQEYCVHDLELRAYVVEGAVEAIIYTKFLRIKDNGEFGDFEELFTAAEAASAWMHGDGAALADAERQCRVVTKHWLQWVQAQACEVPAAIRFDYFVHRVGPGKATVWTFEICELGFSMLGNNELPAKVFRAMLRQCLEQPRGRRGGSVPETAWGAETVLGPTSAGAKPAKAAGKQAGSKGAPKEKAPKRAGKGGGTGGQVLPATISLTTPNGIPPQKKCTGKYALEPSTEANGRPVWKHTRIARWIYCGTDNNWYVGDDDEHKVQFQCCEGYVRLQGAANGVLPHQGAGKWERFDTKEDEWRLDKDIVAVGP